MKVALLLLPTPLFLVSCQTKSTGDYAIERESMETHCGWTPPKAKKSQFSGHPPVKGFSVPTSTK